jgi:hypothetical protein
MRLYTLWLTVCAVGLLATAAPANAANTPPRPIVASHGVKVKAGYVGLCPRRARKPRCAIPDFFAMTKPLPVHSGSTLRINARRRVRRLRLNLDCPHHRSDVIDRTRWTFEVSGGGCSAGELDITYRRTRAAYTFSLADHRHCELDESATVGETESVRVYSFWSGDDDEPERAENEFFACRWDSGRTSYLGREFYGDAYYGADFLEPVTLAGEKVAYVTARYSGRYGPDRFSSLRVLDTATRQIGEITSTREGFPATRRRFTALVLKPNGSVAWILEREDYTSTQPPYYSATNEVWKADTGGMTLLDSDPEVRSWSLRLDGSTLTWLRGEETRSATLD